MKIFAPVGMFASVAEAAHAEESINWQDEYGPDHRACILSFAAEEIAVHFSLVDGMEISMQPLPSRIDVPGIYLITVAELDELELRPDLPEIEVPEPDQGFTIATLSEGDDFDSIIWLIVGSDSSGALSGAYTLLDHLGFRWLSPDPWDRVIPDRIEPVAIDTTEAPSFSLRGFWATDDRGTGEFLLWMARNRLNLWSAEQPQKAFCRKLGLRFTTGGHKIFARYADPGTWFEEHPEWYGLQNGQRSSDIRGNVGDNICFANDGVRKHIAESLAEDLAEGEWKWVDLINIWALDNGRYCTCEECKAIGNPTDMIMLLAHDCRTAIRKAQAEGRINREVIVSVPAYHETLPVPEHPLPEGFDHEGIVATFFPIERCFVHNFADPGCTEMNAPLAEFWDRWTRNPDNPFKGAMLVGEYYNVSAYASLAIPATSTMSADIPYYYRSGARLMHYMHVSVSDWGPLALTNMQFARLLWNHEADSQQLIADFLISRYRDSAPAMAIAYRQLEDAMKNAKPMKHYAGMKRHTLRNTIRKGAAVAVSTPVEASEELFTTRHLRFDTTSLGSDSGSSLTDTVDLLQRTVRFVEDTQVHCSDELVRRRIAADLRRLRYTRDSVAFTYHALRLRMLEAAGDEASAAEEARELRNAGETLRLETRMPKLTTGDDDTDLHRFYVNGLTATWVADFYDETMQRYGFAKSTETAPGGEVI